MSFFLLALNLYHLDHFGAPILISMEAAHAWVLWQENDPPRLYRLADYYILANSDSDLNMEDDGVFHAVVAFRALLHPLAIPMSRAASNDTKTASYMYISKRPPTSLFGQAAARPSCT
jgi:hypothetical protein